jgi:predicted nuclease of restriction endonuclease-like (RecB) superfamily
MTTQQPTPIPGRATMPAWYPELLTSVAGRVSAGHRRAVAAANTELVSTYWLIGRDILDRQDQEGYGTKVIDRLSADLKDRFPEARGFSARNLKYMRAFAAAWQGSEVVQAPLAQLPWYHHLALLERLKRADQRLWYAATAVQNGWSRDILALQIETGLHERSGKAVTNFAATLPPTDSDLAQQATKDPYLFDFLTQTDTVNERALERGLVEHVQQFLLELGQGFAFVGRQVKLVIGQQEFFCDLLFYHYRLRRFVVIELKAVAFEPGHIGQLGMYLAAIDDLMAQPDDGPTVGLLLCRTKDDVVAEYALRGSTQAIGVAEWTTQLTRSLPAELAGQLPSIDELENELRLDPSPDAEHTTGPA